MADSPHNAKATDVDSPPGLASSPRYSPIPSPPLEPVLEQPNIKPVRSIDSEEPLPAIKIDSPEGLTSDEEALPAPPPSPRPAMLAAPPIPCHTPPPPPRPHPARLAPSFGFERSIETRNTEKASPRASTAGDDALDSRFLTRSFVPPRMVSGRRSHVDDANRGQPDAERNFLHRGPPLAKKDAESGRPTLPPGPFKNPGGTPRNGPFGGPPKCGGGDWVQEKEAPQEVEESNADFRARIARGPKARMDAKLAPERVAGEAKQEDDLKTQRPGDSVAHHPERVVREGGAMSDGHFQWQPFNPRHQIGNDRPQENGPQKGLLSKSEASDLDHFFGDQGDFGKSCEGPSKVTFLPPLRAVDLGSGEKSGFGKSRADIAETEEQTLQRAIAESLKDAKREGNDYHTPATPPVSTGGGSMKKRRQEEKDQEEDQKTTLRFKKDKDGKWHATDTSERFLRHERKGEYMPKPEATARRTEREDTPMPGMLLRETQVPRTPSPPPCWREMKSNNGPTVSGEQKSSAAEDGMQTGRNRSELIFGSRRSRSSSVAQDIFDPGSTMYVFAKESDPVQVKSCDQQHSQKNA